MARHRSMSRRVAVVGVLSAVAGSIVLTAAPAFAADSTGPLLTRLSIVGGDSYVANVTHDATQVGVLISATDDQSGLADADVTVTCTSNCSGTGDAFEESDTINFTGPPTRVSGPVSITIPQSARTGTWQVTKVVLTDAAGNPTTVTSTTTLGTHRTFSVAKTSDNTPPTVSAISVAGSNIDVTTTDKLVSLTVHASDATSGVASGEITLVCSSGCQTPGDTRPFPFTASNLATGTPLSGSWLTIPILFTQFDTGTWSLQTIDVQDAYGNHQATIGALAVSFTVTASADTVAPGVTGTPSFAAPGSVNVTTGGATINLTGTFTDSVSGVFSGFGTLSGNGPDISFSFDRSSNTTGNTFVIPIAVPARQPAGTYSFTVFELFDRDFNQTNPATTGWPSLVVTDTSDSAGPSVNALTFGPTPFNEYDNFHSAFINADISDNASGFTTADGHFTDPLGKPIVINNLLTSNKRVSGTGTSGHYITQFNPFANRPSGDPLNGTWTLVSLDLHDLAGNTNPGVVVNKSITVTNADPHDVSGPVVASGGITFSEFNLDTSSGDATLHVHAHVNDPGGSGFSHGVITVKSPGGATVAKGGAFNLGGLTSGDDSSGGYDLALTIPKFAATGTWTLTDVDLFDNVGNESDLKGAALFNVAGSQQVTVSGPIDTTKPKLTSVAASPTAVTVATDETVSFTIHATDSAASNDGSGVIGGSVTLTSPTGRTSFADFSTATDLTSGTPQDATIATKIILPTFAESGSWSVSINLFDRQGNSSSYSPGDISGLPSSTSAISVTGAPDTRAPLVTGLNFMPTSVATSSGDQPLIVLAHVTDNQATSDGSGVQSVSIDLASPHGVQSDLVGNFALVAGDDNDGWWSTGFDIPKFVDNGTWNVKAIRAQDNYGNQHVYNAGDLSALGQPTGIPITGPPDTAAPTLVTGGVTLPATTTDVTSGDKQIIVGLHLHDSDGAGNLGSGVASGSIEVQGPNGATEVGALPVHPTSGTVADGVWNVPITIHRFTDDGTWHLTKVTIEDLYGNQVTLTGAAAFTGDNTALVVHSFTDTSPPILTSLSFAPASVDVTDGSALVTVTVGVTDNSAGFDGGAITLSIAGANPVTGIIGNTPLTGTPTDGTFAATLTVPQFATDGTWHVTDLTLSDTVNNIVEYPSPTAFPNNGNVTTTLGVTDVTADINPPAVADNGIAISLTPVDLSEGPQQVTFDLHLTDDNSGVVPGGSFTLKSPTGVVQTIQLNNLATGSPSDGHWIVQVPFGIHDENGTWTIDAVDIADAAGNAAHIVSVPTTNTFTVENSVPSAPSAPTAVSGTSHDGGVDLTWTAPSDDGGSPVTGYHVQYSSNAGSTWHNTSSSFDTSAAVSGTVDGLTNGQTYVFQVAAINPGGTGNYSVFSDPVTLPVIGPTDASALSIGGTKAIRYAASVAISTILIDRTANNSPITGASVQLKARAGTSGAFTNVGTPLTTSSAGAASKIVKPAVNTQYEWRYAGNTIHIAATSKAQTISVAQVVTARVRPAKVKHKKPAKLYGLVSPKETGQKVVLQQLVKGKWKSLKVTATVKLQALPGSSRKVPGYILTIKEPKKGNYIFRVSRAKTTRNAAGVSNTVKLKVT